MENPPIPFLPNVPERVDYDPVEVSPPLPWNLGSQLFPPSADFKWLGLRAYEVSIIMLPG